MKKRLLSTVLILTILIAVAFVYINRFFLPVKAKDIVIQKLQDILQRPVKIEAMHLSLMKGFLASNIAVFEKDDPQKFFLTIDEISFRFFIPNIFKNQSIIIPSLNIKNPNIHIQRRAPDTFNFSDLLKPSGAPAGKSKTPPVIIGGLAIDNGKIFYSDPRLDAGRPETLENIGIKASLTLTKSIKFSLQADIAQTPSTFRADGEYHLASRQLTAHCTVEELIIKRYLDLFYTNTNLTLHKGSIESADINLKIAGKGVSLDGQFSIPGLGLTWQGQKEISGDFSADKLAFKMQGKEISLLGNYKLTGAKIQWGTNKSMSGNIATVTALKISDTTVDIKNNFELKDAQFVLADGKKASGSPAGELAIQFDRADPKGTLRYRGSLKLADIALAGIPKIKTIENIQGILELETDKARFAQLNVKALNTDIVLSGSVENFKDPSLDIQYSSNNVDLEKMLNLVPDVLEEAHMSAAGQAGIKGSYKGLLSSPLEADVKLTAQLKNSTLKKNDYPDPVTDLNGQIEVRPNSLNLKDLRGTFQKRNFTLNGSLVNFKSPDINVNLAGDAVQVAARLQIPSPKTIQILSAKGNYLNSSFDLEGDVQMSDEHPPRMGLSGSFNLNLEDLANVNPEMNKKFTPLKLQGILTSNFTFRGSVKDWHHWQLLISSHAPWISAAGLKWEDVNFKFKEEDQYIGPCTLTSSVYGGQLLVTASADLTTAQDDFLLNFNLQKIDLSQAPQNIAVKIQDLQGILDSSFSVHGSLTDLDTIEGTGFLIVKDGLLWQSKLLKGLWDALAIREFKEVIFTEAYGDFDIQKQRLETNNLTLKSDSVNLLMTGWVDFKQKINLLVSPQFSEASLLQSASPFKTPTEVLTKISKYTGVKITGTVQNPKYYPFTDPGKLLKETIGTTFEGAKDILEEIF